MSAGARARRGVWLPHSELPDGRPIIMRKFTRRELTVLVGLDDRQDRADGELVELEGLDESILEVLALRGLVTLLDRDGRRRGGVTPGGDRALERRGV